MDQTSLNVSSVAKSNSVKSTAVNDSEESSGSESFISKLASFFQSDKESVESAEGAGSEEVSTEQGSESVDQLLASDSDAESEGAEASDESTDALLQQAEAEQTVEESGELLDRLGESNQTLTQASGTKLPLDEDSLVESSKTGKVTSDDLIGDESSGEQTSELGAELAKLQDAATINSVFDPSQLESSESSLMQANRSSDGDSEISAAESAAIAAAASQVNWDKTSLDGQKVGTDAETKAKLIQQLQGQQLQSQQALNSNQLQSLAAAADRQAASAAGLTPDTINSSSNPQNLVAEQLAVANPAMQNQTLKAALAGAAGASMIDASHFASGSPDSANQGDGKDSGLSQQLSGLAAQQGAQQIQARSELQQAIQQSPLQLTKDVASDKLADQVQMMLSKNLKNVDIRLDPPELGRLQIKMAVNSDVASVHFTVANQQAKEVIDGAMPRLREMLAQQGVQLSESSVQQQGSQQQNQFAGQEASGGGSKQYANGEEVMMDEGINLNANVGLKEQGISFYA